MRVVVTGSEGFIGQRVVRLLLQKGYHVLGVDLTDVAKGSDYIYVQSDLSDAAQPVLGKWLQGEGFTLVHLAWSINRRSGYSLQVKSLMALANFLDAWGGNGLVKVVGMGSAEEYGDAEGCLEVATQASRYLSPYGWAKHAAYEMARDWSVRRSIPVVWLRPFIVYGEGQGGDMLIPYALRCIAEGKEADFTEGRQKRDFVHVHDVARAVLNSVRTNAAGIHVHNIGTGVPVCVRAVLEKIAEQLDAQGMFRYGMRAMRGGEPSVQYADISASSLPGWQPEVSLDEGLSRITEIGTKRKV